jgi:hypothetical protein
MKDEKGFKHLYILFASKLHRLPTLRRPNRLCKRTLKLKEVAISTSIQFQILSLFVCPKKPQQVAKVNKKLME